MTLVYAKKKMQSQKKGSRNVMGAELCLAHDIGGGGIGGPLLVDMRPYGCFIKYGELYVTGPFKMCDMIKHMVLYSFSI